RASPQLPSASRRLRGPSDGLLARAGEAEALVLAVDGAVADLGVEAVEAARRWSREPIAVEIEARGVARADEAALLGVVVDAAAGVRTHRRKTGHAVAASLQPHRAESGLV